MVSNACKEVILRIKIEFQDYKSFYLQQYKKYITLMAIGFFISFNLTIALLIYVETHDIPDMFSTLKITVPIGIIATGLIILFYVVRLNYKSKKNFLSDKLICQELEWALTDAGMILNTETSAMKITWDNIYKVIEVKNQYYIYIARNKAFTIPKRFLTEAVQIKNLREILQSNLPDKKVKLRKLEQLK